MKRKLFFILALCPVITINAQQIDANFANNGIFIFDPSGITFSRIVDFDVLDNNQIVGLTTSGSEGYVFRLNANGDYDTTFNTTGQLQYADDGDITPRGIQVKSNGDILVLSREFKFLNSTIGSNFIVTVNEYNEDGTLDTNFATDGKYENNVSGNQDSNYAEDIHLSSTGDIILAGEIVPFNPTNGIEKVMVLKLSEMGVIQFTELYDTEYSSFSCSTMVGDNLFLGSWQPTGTDQAVILDLDVSTQMTTSLVSRTISAGNEQFEKIVVINTDIYASNIESSLDDEYAIRKYDSNGDLDMSYGVSGKIDLITNTFDTDFVVNDNGEALVVSVDANDRKNILITKFLSNGLVDSDFGTNGEYTITMNNDVVELGELRLKENDDLYISGDMDISNDDFAFLTKVRVNTDALSVQDLLLDSDVIIFPNPSNSKINIGGALQNFTTGAIIDINGRQIKNIDFSENLSSVLLTVDLSNVSKGVYYLKLSTNNKETNIFKKIVVE